MNDELDDAGFSIESLGEDTTENARHQLSLLAKSLGSAHDPAETPALLDEAYRAAHSLKAAIDAQRMPNVDRLARRMQDVVRAARGGSLAASIDLASVLESVARIARDALDAVAAGSPEPLSASTAAAALEEMLEHPGTWSAPPALSARPFKWAKVEVSRLGAAGHAAGEARAASAAYARAAAAAAELSGKLRSSFSVHETAVRRLRESVPGALATAARGEPTTAVTAEIAEVLSAISLTNAELDRAIAESSAAVREAAVLGTRTAERCETALTTLHSVRLDALLLQLPGTVRRRGQRAGALEFVHEPSNVEVAADRADEVVSVLRRCLLAFAGLHAPKRRRAGRAVAGPALRLSLSSRAVGNDLGFRFALAGWDPGAAQLRDVLLPVQRRVERFGGRVEIEAQKGQGLLVMLSMPSAAVVASRSAEFVFARAGETWYALPASAVVECIEAGLSIDDYRLDGARPAALRMNDTRDPRQGVAVQTPRGGALLLFDAIGARETGIQTTGAGDSGGMAGISGSVRRPDGSIARLVDLAVLLPEPRQKIRVVVSGKAGGSRPRH